MSWSFFTSFSGYLNLGHVIFIGLAGYTSAALNYHLGWPMWLCMIVGVARGHRRRLAVPEPDPQAHHRAELRDGELPLDHRDLEPRRFELRAAVDRRRHRAVADRRPLSTTWDSPSRLRLLCVACGFGFAWYLKSDSGKVIDFASENQSIVKAGRRRPPPVHGQAAPAQRPGRQHRRRGVRPLLGGGRGRRTPSPSPS